MTPGNDASGKGGPAKSKPHCIIVAGPNGAGKTTSSRALATERHDVHRIVNADTIAVGLAGSAELGAIAAGKLAVAAQRRYIADRENFAIETTLSGRRWSRVLDDLDQAGFLVTVYYLWIPRPEICVARVRSRVMLGGHGVPDADIRRRYITSLSNAFTVLMPRVHEWHVLNAGALGRLLQIASGGAGRHTEIVDSKSWAMIQNQLLSPSTNGENIEHVNEEV